MLLLKIINELKRWDLIQAINADENMQINRPVYNSLEVMENDLFICKGINFKEEYLKQAIDKKAACAVSEKKVEGIPYIQVTDVRKALACIVNVYYDFPSKKLNLYAVTGTKGKTTSSFLIYNILNDYQKPAGIISSVKVNTGAYEKSNDITTPESMVLQKYLYDMVNAKVKDAVVEVSSQGVKMHRVDGLEFDTGIFLNIGTDHISPNEHKDFADYLLSKMKLFDMCKVGIINGDDGLLRGLISDFKCEVITFGFDKNNDVVASDVEKSDGYTSFNVKTPWFSDRFKMRLEGSFNIYNCLAAISACGKMGVGLKSIKQGIENTLVDGRMQVVKSEKATFIIDYAHNKMSFETLIEDVKKDNPKARIITVFGCPGGKGLNRRKELGEVADKLSDYVILTQDDNDYENTTDICKEINSYIKSGKSIIIEERDKAIIHAYEYAQEGDIVLLLGKGNEKSMKVNGKSVPYKGDFEILKEYI